MKDLIEQAQLKTLKCQPGRTIVETFENSVNKVLNSARDTAGTSALRSLERTNNFKEMVDAGSKGSFINISLVCLFLIFVI